MSRRILIAVAVVLVAIGILLNSSVFIVDQTESALVLQFGQPRREVRQPGLWFKRPFVENVVYYDNRVLDFEPRPEEVIVSDQKRLVVDSYARYRIIDPLLFYQTVGTEQGVRGRLSAIVNGSLRRVLGNVTLSDILGGKPPVINGETSLTTSTRTCFSNSRCIARRTRGSSKGGRLAFSQVACTTL